MDSISFVIGYVIDYKNEKNYSVDIFINGRDLRDIIRDVELPYFSKAGNPGRAGGYLGLPPKAVFLPSRHFLDKPNRLYCYGEKRAIYRCVCGDVHCGPMLVDITITDDKILWDNFENPYHSTLFTDKPWDYSSLKFVFDKKQYELELSKIKESELGQYAYTR